MILIYISNFTFAFAFFQEIFVRPFNIIWISWKKSPSEIIYDTAKVAKNIVTLSSSGFDIKTKGNKSLTGNLESHALVVSSLFIS